MDFQSESFAGLGPSLCPVSCVGVACEESLRTEFELVRGDDKVPRTIQQVLWLGEIQDRAFWVRTLQPVPTLGSWDPEFEKRSSPDAVPTQIPPHPRLGEARFALHIHQSPRSAGRAWECCGHLLLGLRHLGASLSFSGAHSIALMIPVGAVFIQCPLSARASGSRPGCHTDLGSGSGFAALP